MRFNIIMIFAYILLGLVVDTALWLLHPKPARKIWRMIYFSFCILCYALLAVALAMPWNNINTLITPKMWLLYSWLSIYAVKTSMVIWGLIGILPRLWKGRWIPLGMYVGLPLGLIVFAIMWWGAIEGRRVIEVRPVDITSERVPEAFDGFRILQISDLHLGSWDNDTSFISQLADSINSQKADMIVFTGDIVNRDASEIKPFMPVLSRLKAPYGVFSIMGNHDYSAYGSWPSQRDSAANVKLIRNMQAKMGWRLLENRNIAIHRDNDSIILLGVENWGEPPFPSYGDFKAALTISADSIPRILSPFGPEFKILLTHNPEHWRQIISRESNTDLTLSGHTHGMQMEVRMGSRRWSPGAWRYPTWGGLYALKEGKTKPQPLLYVNIGAGTVGLPFRIEASPEITVFTLRHSDKANKPKYVE